MSDALELTNASPRSIEYAWIDMLEDDDRALVDSLYLRASWAALDDDPLALDLREAAKRIGDLWFHMTFGHGLARAGYEAP